MDLRVALEDRNVPLDALVPAVGPSERRAQAGLAIVDRAPRFRIREGMECAPMGRAGREERVLVREVRVDGMAFDACLGGDGRDRRSRRADAGVEFDRRLDDAAAGLRLPFGSPLQLVLPCHCTTVYSE